MKVRRWHIFNKKYITWCKSKEKNIDGKDKKIKGEYMTTNQIMGG